MELKDLGFDEKACDEILGYVKKIDNLAAISVQKKRTSEKLFFPLMCLGILPHLFMLGLFYGDFGNAKDILSIPLFIGFVILSIICFTTVFIVNMISKKSTTKLQDFLFGEAKPIFSKHKLRYIPPSFEYTMKAKGKLIHVPSGVTCRY